MRLLVATDHRFVLAEGRICDAYGFNGAFFSDYLTQFDEVEVACRVRHGLDSEATQLSEGPGLEFLRMPDFRGIGWLRALSPHNLGVIRAAVDRANAVCVRIPSTIGYLTARMARRQGRPVMFEMIGDPAATNRGAWDRGGIAGRASAFLARRAISYAVAGSYVSLGHLQQRYPPRRPAMCDAISSIRLPDWAILVPRPERNAGPLKVICVASLVPVKDHAVLLRAAGLAISKGACSELILVGDGVERARLERLAQALGVRNAVRFCGHIAERSVIDRLLDEADIFALASMSEGLPRAMIEAMARGLPVIGTRTGGIAELVPPECSVAVGDYPGLAELITWLASSPAQMAELSVRSVQMAGKFVQSKLSEKRRRLLAHLRAVAITRGESK